MGIWIAISGESPIELEGDNFVVGRAPDCNLSLPNDSRLQPRHLVLKRVANRWIAEAATNELIQVGDARPGRMNWLKAGDVIKLTSSGPELIFQPASSAVAEQSTGNRAGPEGPLRGGVSGTSGLAALTKPPAVWLLGGALLLVLIVIGGSLRPRKSGATAAPQAQTQTPAQVDSPTLSPAKPEETAAIEPVVKPPAGALQSLYVVLKQMPSLEQPGQIGTAWAVAPHQLVTSAAVVVELEGSRDATPKTTVFCPTTKAELPVKAWKAHPEFLKARDEAKQAKAADGEIRLELANPALEPAKKEELTKLAEETYERFCVASERQVLYDLGVIDVSGELPTLLPLCDPSQPKPKGAAKLRLAGIPFVLKQHDWDSQDPRMPVELSAKAMVWEPPGKDPQWLILKSQVELKNQVWCGSPLLNAEGQVVAIYSGPTPAPLDSAEQIQNTHFAVDVARLRELAPQLK